MLIISHLPCAFLNGWSVLIYFASLLLLSTFTLFCIKTIKWCALKHAKLLSKDRHCNQKPFSITPLSFLAGSELPPGQGTTTTLLFELLLIECHQAAKHTRRKAKLQPDCPFVYSSIFKIKFQKTLKCLYIDEKEVIK